MNLGEGLRWIKKVILKQKFDVVRSLEIYAAHALSCPSEKVSLSAAAPRVPDVGTPSISRQMFAKSKSFSSQQNQDYEPCDVHVLLQCDDQFKVLKDQRKQKNSVKLLKFCLTRRLKNYSQKFQLKESYQGIPQGWAPCRCRTWGWAHVEKVFEGPKGVWHKGTSKLGSHQQPISLDVLSARGPLVITDVTCVYLRPLWVLLALPAAVFFQRTANPGPNVPVPKAWPKAFEAQSCSCINLVRLWSVQSRKVCMASMRTQEIFIGRLSPTNG